MMGEIVVDLKLIKIKYKAIGLNYVEILINITTTNIEYLYMQNCKVNM